MNKLSVVIITFNESQNIGRCIASVKAVADEVIVLDSFSTDNTVDIALAHGALVQQQTFSGYIQQKNRAIKLASHNYILSIDADEVLSAELAAAVLQEKAVFKYKAYKMNRSNIYCGHLIKHGLWYPDKKLRLFDKRYGSFGGLDPHDKVITDSGIFVQQFKGDLLHYTYQSAAQYKQRNEEITDIAAESLFNTGKKIYWPRMIFSPLWSFINGYFLRCGFLDGQHGFIIAIHSASQSYKKYYKLRLLKQAAVKHRNVYPIINFKKN
jgi:glycosyltransferase involved in cell wall biosynthesis